MPKTFSQIVHFDASPATLFSLYTNAKLHGESTGAGAAITATVGKAFTAWDGYIGGVNLHVEKDRMVVQTWRASDWKRGESDSILVLLFLPDGEGSLLHLSHVNIPDERFEGVKEGWKEYYWKPWKAWLKRAAAGKKPPLRIKSS